MSEPTPENRHHAELFNRGGVLVEQNQVVPSRDAARPVLLNSQSSAVPVGLPTAQQSGPLPAVPNSGQRYETKDGVRDRHQPDIKMENCDDEDLTGFTGQDHVDLQNVPTIQHQESWHQTSWHQTDPHQSPSFNTQTPRGKPLDDLEGIALADLLPYIPEQDQSQSNQIMKRELIGDDPQYAESKRKKADSLFSQHTETDYWTTLYSDYEVATPGFEVTTPDEVFSPGFEAATPGYELAIPGYQVETPGFEVAITEYDVVTTNYEAITPGYDAAATAEFPWRSAENPDGQQSFEVRALSLNKSAACSTPRADDTQPVGTVGIVAALGTGGTEGVGKAVGSVGAVGAVGSVGAVRGVGSVGAVGGVLALRDVGDCVLEFTHEPPALLRPSECGDGKRGILRDQQGRTFQLRFRNLSGVGQARITSSLVLPDDGQIHPDYKLERAVRNEPESDNTEAMIDVQDETTYDAEKMRIGATSRVGRRVRKCARWCRIQVEAELLLVNQKPRLLTAQSRRIYLIGQYRMQLVMLTPTEASSAGGSLLYVKGSRLVNKAFIASLYVVFEEVRDANSTSGLWSERVAVANCIAYAGIAKKVDPGQAWRNLKQEEKLELIEVLIPAHPRRNEKTAIDVYLLNDFTTERTSSMRFCYLPAVPPGI